MAIPATSTGFDGDLRDILPRLRIYAMSLTRNPDRAEDLVQQTALQALRGRESFRPGSNFSGWMFRIQRNEFISNIRRQRPTVDIDEARVLFHAPRQEGGLILREFVAAFRQLSKSSRQALLLAQLEGCSHEQIARHAGVSVGTVKSRISRARAALRHLLDPETSDGAGLH